MSATPESIEVALPEPDRPGLGREAHVLFAVAVIAVLTLLFWPHAGEDDAPGGVLRTAAGDTIELEERSAPVTLVHFWATWCPPCVTETPSIRRLAASLADEPRFALVMVAVADDEEAAVEFLDGPEFSGDAATLFDPDWATARRFGTEKLPETHLLVDGQVAESFIGAQNWDDPALRQKITDAIDRVGG